MESKQMIFEKMLRTAVDEGRARLYQMYGVGPSGRELTDDEIRKAFRDKYGRDPEEIFGPCFARSAGPIPASGIGK